ncbi:MULTISPECIES: cobalt ECF transporter T component CbiQ [Thermomonospora]|uniref:Cobalt/nickel transport system permease protein n=1 Tax=Thermomonospora cellulosilytica TaxID=1411118 RepID=A0A7W3R8A1_9ACTN|nr:MULTISPECIES: cobalt ECF transporter T component CbiQ [Thermomonospora]MBA9004108.1 cobalt/nickel transport system permease protein [Thermomonospora cellulosilytica]
MDGLGRRLHRPGDTPVHRLPPQCKLAAAGLFVLAVVSTPREAVWAFGVYAVLLAAVAAAARVPAGFVLRRMAIEVPFVVFAVLLPFVAQGPRVEVLGVALSESGLWSAWNVLAKASLGTAASVLLAATTELRQLLLGLERLRLPSLLVQIAAFMVRYADVIVGEMRRMKVARAARGFEARDVRAFGVLARSAGALFLRSYERGERVHLAMLSRGYEGRMPVLHDAAATRAQWAAAAVLPALAALVASGAWMVR